MARVYVANKKGSAFETGNAAPGYAPSGVSEFSRAATHGRAMGAGVPFDQPVQRRVTAELIERQTKLLEKIEAKLATANLSHAKRARLESDRLIKRKFIAELKKEKGNGNYRRGRIEV